MIFDNKKVTELVLEYQRTKDIDTLEKILQETERLIKVIVLTYNPIHQDDLIQEACLRLQKYAILGYKPEYKLHNYFTTVIHNACRSYLKEVCGDTTEELDEEYTAAPDNTSNVYTDTVARNKERFTEYDGALIELATFEVVGGILEGVSPSVVICRIADSYPIDKSLATCIYYSTLIYLRFTKSEDGCNPPCDPPQQNSIEWDILEFMGTGIYLKLKLLLKDIPITL